MFLVCGIGVAAADPAPANPSTATSASSSTSAPTPVSSLTGPPRPMLTMSQSLLWPPTPTQVPSLRLEAVRIANERASADWRYPEPGPLVGLDGGAWFYGAGYYRPRSARSAALHGGSIAATMVGEILIATGSPLAGVGALVTGATLDAAGADADRDAEARH
jgi:hypothetical protein